MARLAHVGRKTREGTVVSDKMDKTVVVAVASSVRHRLYKKIVRRLRRYMAHDETNDAKLGDRVRIVESRPYSRRKRWQLVEVLIHADRPEVAAEEIDLELLGEVKAEKEEAPKAEEEPEAAAEAETEPEAVMEAVAEPEVAEEPEAVMEVVAEPEVTEEPVAVEEAVALEEPEVTEEPEAVEEAEAETEPEAVEESEAVVEPEAEAEEPPEAAEPESGAKPESESEEESE